MSEPAGDRRPLDGAAASAVLAWLRERGRAMTALLAELARAESPSHDGRAQLAMRDLLTRELTDIGLRVAVVPGHDGCDHLHATLPEAEAEAEAGPRQLLLGHLDTVWPLGTIQGMPVEVRDGRMYGPGVFDMKAGLVQMLYALRALRSLGHRPECAPVVLINADEEVGSDSSAGHIRTLARDSERVFVMEPAYGSRGDLKTGRKGIGRYTLTVRGVASHAGLDPAAGVSAIQELSRQIDRLFALNDHQRGITVNVGTIDGGLRPNVVAPLATAQIETRVVTAADADEIGQAIIGLRPTRDRIRIEVTGGVRRPPMEPTAANQRIWHTARRAARTLGLEIDQARVGGGSDGNFTSPITATLDGLGAVGDGAHADHEYVVIDAMPERAALLAALLMTPPERAHR